MFEQALSNTTEVIGFCQILATVTAACVDVARKQAVMEGYRLLDRSLKFARELREKINSTGAFRVLELDDTFKLVNGEPVAPKEGTQPFEVAMRDEDFAIVKEEAPEVWARLEEASSKLDEIDGRLEEINTQIETTALPDAVRLVDPLAADELVQLTKIVNDPNLPKSFKEATVIRVQALVKRMGEDKIAKTLNDSEIAPKYEARTLSQSRKAANRKYKDAYRAVDTERQRLVTARRAIAQAAPDMTNQPLRYDVVEAAAARSATSAEGIDVEASRIVESAKPLELTDIEDDGLINIGLPERIPADTRITITGDDGNPRSMTVREAMDELDEDVRLEEAMTTCAVGGPNEL